MMKRIGKPTLGVLLIGVFFAWLILRHQEPLSVWAASSTILGWVIFGGAWLSCIGGVWLIATAWNTRPSSSNPTTDANDH
ncbi:MAG: hypothetical protein ACTHZM_10030 [Canibacter sp.]